MTNEFNYLVKEQGYQTTDEFNGLTCTRKRRLATVVRAARYPVAAANLNPNIVAVAVVEDQLGKLYDALVTAEGKVL